MRIPSWLCLLPLGLFGATQAQAVPSNAATEAEHFEAFLQHTPGIAHLRTYGTGRCHMNIFLMHPNRNDDEACARVFVYTRAQQTEIVFMGQSHTMTLFSPVTAIHPVRGYPIQQASMARTGTGPGTPQPVAWKTPGQCTEDDSKKYVACTGFDGKVGYQLTIAGP